MSSTQPPSYPAEPSTQPSSGTSVLEREELREDIEPGDHERFAHYVRKEKILASAMSGDPVVALCGKVWTPGRDPKKYPVCPACKEIYEGIQSGGSGSGGSGGSGAGFGSGSGE
ncbi:DUF3039 domain-containing protein [Georgenia faecalis]|uniref:DUF3039 domain-containing protein n=1 Tax=Georgenia faecalis TaxID=2483799 RepID=A0ABV9DEZ8_9MICO|nr:DUF3039 domain-containing protein [Georgenia faecalis]